MGPIEPPASADAATAAALKTCSVACKAAVAYYLDEEEAAQSEFGRCLLQAAAAIDAAAAAAFDADTDERNATFAIAVPICRAATAHCRRAGLDTLLLKAAAACERAATICESRR